MGDLTQLPHSPLYAQPGAWPVSFLDDIHAALMDRSNAAAIGLNGNALQNPSFRWKVAPVDTSWAVGAISKYPCDRWHLVGNTTGNTGSSMGPATVIPASGVARGANGFSLYLQGANAEILAAASTLYLRQLLYGVDAAPLLQRWGTADAVSITLSFWARCSVAGTFYARLALYNSAHTLQASECLPFTFTAVDTWQYFTVTFPPHTSVTPNTAFDWSLAVDWVLIAGSNFVGTPGVWNATDIQAGAATNWAAAGNPTFYLYEPMLNLGAFALDYALPDLDLEYIGVAREAQSIAGTVVNNIATLPAAVVLLANPLNGAAAPAFNLTYASGAGAAWTASSIGEGIAGTMHVRSLAQTGNHSTISTFTGAVYARP